MWVQVVAFFQKTLSDLVARLFLYLVELWRVSMRRGEYEDSIKKNEEIKNKVDNADSTEDIDDALKDATDHFGGKP